MTELLPLKVYPFSLSSIKYISDPPVRLADGTAKDRGRVEVYHEQKGWGTICNTDWSVNDADVFCKELGYAEGQLHV